MLESYTTISGSESNNSDSEDNPNAFEMMKTILSIGNEDKDLKPDRPAANGGYFVLELLQATFFDSATAEAAQEMANMIQNPSREASQDWLPNMTIAS